MPDTGIQLRDGTLFERAAKPWRIAEEAPPEACSDGWADGSIDAAVAFRFADRRCRVLPEPCARDYLLRSLLHLKLGRADRSLADLNRAAFVDAADPVVLWTRMLRDPDGPGRIEAAQALIDDPRTTPPQVSAALQALLALRPGPVVKVDRQDRRLSGWIVWRGAADPVVEARSEALDLDVHISCVPEPWCPPAFGHLARFHLACEPYEAVEVTVRMPGLAPTIVNVYPAETSAVRPVPRPLRSVGPQGLDVIVPIYKDAAATEACLAALVGQTADCPVRFWLVDDHSLESRVVSIAEEFAGRLGATLIVNRINHGFAGSVNRALERSPGGDVLLLNADVILPPNALRRLMSAAYSARDIGTVMPMSNDGEFTSFPVPYRANPACAPEFVRRIDDAARLAHGDAVVDVANTIGFCQYVTQDCLARTGLLSQAYGRGYYEDVDLSLRARDFGFRSVAATGLYVSHAGGRSFLQQKTSLVARNLPILERRFPAYSLRCATYVTADPLRAARSAIEERLPPARATHLLIGRSAFDSVAMARRAGEIAEQGGFVMLLAWVPGVEIRLRAAAGFGPHALHFPLDAAGAERLSRYLADSNIVAIEIDDPGGVPAVLWRLLGACQAPQAVLLGSLETARWLFAEDGSSDSTAPASAVVALDAMARAYLARRGRLPSACRSAAGLRKGARRPALPAPKTCIGIPVPQADVAVDALLVGLARRLGRAGSPTLVVLGRCIDDRPLMATGRVHVTGPIDPDDYPDVIDDYRIDGLFSPYRTSSFGFTDDLARATSRPKAYFDWSGQMRAPEAGDLALSPVLSEAALCDALLAWCNPILPT